MNRDRIDSLIARYLAAEATCEERERLEQLLASSPEYQQRFTETEAMWTASTMPVVRDAPPKEQAWQDLIGRIGLVSATDRPQTIPALQRRAKLPSGSFRFRSILAVAAVLLIVSGGLLLRQYRGNPDNRTIPWQKITTSNGQRLQVMLPDNSTVRLNAATTLSFAQDFADSVRRVHLEGEAYFEVQSDAERPFVVRTLHSTILVQGTLFNVWTRKDETRVMVKEGSVSLQALETPFDMPVIVSASQMSIHRADAPPESPYSVNVDHRLGWLEGALVFDRTPLSEIVDELQRYYDVSIVLADSRLEMRHLTATFRNQSLETVLSAICLTTDAHHRYEKDAYVISR